MKTRLKCREGRPSDEDGGMLIRDEARFVSGVSYACKTMIIINQRWDRGWFGRRIEITSRPRCWRVVNVTVTISEKERDREKERRVARLRKRKRAHASIHDLGSSVDAHGAHSAE